MALTAVLAPVVLHASAAVAGFGWGGPIRPHVPQEVTPAQPAAPEALVAPGAPAEPIARPAPAARAGGSVRALRPILRIETRDPVVAITFDACATPSHREGFDRKLYDVVKREAIPATIFVSGRWVEAHPDVMTELAADPRIEWGDHSYDHPHMGNLPVARIVAEIDQTEAALAKYGKRSVAFRPPFGEWTSRLVYVAQELRLPTVTWDVVSGDPSASTTVDGMIRNVVGKARAGSIVIFHINGRGHKTAQALPIILQKLRERGLRFVQLSELMAAGRGTPGAPVPIPTAPVVPSPFPTAEPIPTATVPVPIPAAVVPSPPPKPPVLD